MWLCKFGVDCMAAYNGVKAFGIINVFILNKLPVFVYHSPRTNIIEI